MTSARVSLRSKLIEMGAVSALFAAVFFAINVLHFRMIPVGVILYACLLDLMIAAAAVFAGWWFLWRKRSVLLPTELGLTGLASALLLTLYAVMGPTVVDRSLSIYIAEKISHRGGAVAETALPEIILREFMQEYRVADVRLIEQIESGTVTVNNGCIRLTERGEFLAGFTQFYRETLLPKRRRLKNEITSELTTPYANAPVLVPFECPDAEQAT